jgi:glutathione peroxidase
MNYKIVIIGLLSVMGLVSLFSNKLFPQNRGVLPASIYDFKMKALDGSLIHFETYRGKYLLIVNTASKCGYTYQYKDLQQLHEQYGDRVKILGFPSNNFLWQEPGANHEIASFCQKNYGVSFDMFEKISVKGRDKHPLYRWLEEKSGHIPTWNFCKYLIDKNGNVVEFYNSKVNPLDKEILEKII